MSANYLLHQTQWLDINSFNMCDNVSNFLCRTQMCASRSPHYQLFISPDTIIGLIMYSVSWINSYTEPKHPLKDPQYQIIFFTSFPYIYSCIVLNRITISCSWPVSDMIWLVIITLTHGLECFCACFLHSLLTVVVGNTLAFDSFLYDWHITAAALCVGSTKPVESFNYYLYGLCPVFWHFYCDATFIANTWHCLFVLYPAHGSTAFVFGSKTGVM